ncbi:sodium:calcium antiporter [Patescibacteria group bacterium]
MSDNIFFIISLVVLFLSGFWAINALENFGRILRLSQFTLGFVIMAFATNLPELFVGVNAVAQDQAQLSLGDLIGSNLVNLGLILGLVYLLSKKQNYKSIFKRDITTNLLIVAVLLLFISDGLISQIEGFILLFFFGFHIYSLFKEQNLVIGKVKKLYEPKNRSLIYLLSFFFFTALLLISSYYVVTLGTEIAKSFGVSPFVIGLVIIALGTSLPELIFSIHAVMRNRMTMAVGNLLGSALINFTLILGFIASIKPITINIENAWWSIICLVVIGLILFTAEIKK